jgi:hypothetical protein
MLRKYLFVGLLVLSLILPAQSAFATIDSGNVFLQGDYMEAGVSPNGAFGSTVAAPAGYHPRAGHGDEISIVVDYRKDGWDMGTPRYSGDMTLPGTPYEGFGVQWGADGETLLSNTRSGENDIPGALSETSAGLLRAALWTGAATGSAPVAPSGEGVLPAESLDISQELSFQKNGTVIQFDVTLTNSGTDTLTNLMYERGLDPDMGHDVSGNYGTVNQVLHQPDELNDAALVVAQAQEYPDMVIGLGANDSRAVVTAEQQSGFEINPFEVIDTPVAGPITADKAFGIAFDLGDLGPGESTSFTFYYIFTVDELAMIFMPDNYADPSYLYFGGWLVDFPSYTETVTYYNDAGMTYVNGVKAYEDVGCLASDSGCLSGPLTSPVSAAPSMSVSPDFFITNDYCTGMVLAPGDSCTFDVFFRPSQPGWRYGRVDVMTGAYDDNLYDVWTEGYGIEGTQLLLNPSFETDKNLDKRPDKWKPISLAVSKDQMDGNYFTDGLFSMRFVGQSRVQKMITQRVDLDGWEGDALTLSVWTRSLNVPAGALYRAEVVLYNGSTQVGISSVDFAPNISAFFKDVAPIIASADFDHVIVRLVYKATGGKVWFDLAHLNWMHPD